jgi:hypothetical protein
MSTVENLKLNLVFVIYPIAALVISLLQSDFFVTAPFNDLVGKVISTIALVTACVSLHLMQGAFNQFANLLTAAIAFYFVANFLPNFGMGYPVLRNAGNSADLSAEDVSKFSARFLFLTLGLFTALYFFFGFKSNFVLLPTANNAYRRILKTE